MKQLCLLGGVLVAGLLLLGAGCGGDPNVEGAKLALTLDEVDYADYYAKLDESIQADPMNAEAYEVKGRLLQRQAGEVRDPEQHKAIVSQMVEAYNKALEIQPDYPVVTQQMRQAYIDEFQMGIQAFNRGREDESAFMDAVEHFKNTSMIMPDSSGPYVNQAYALIRAGQQEDAIEPFKMAMERGESEADSYMLLANIYQTTDRVDEAVVLLEEGRDMYPDREDLMSQLLNAYISSGQMDRALEDYSQAIEREPDNKLYRYNYGTLLLEAEQYDDAVAQFEAAINLDSEYSVAHYNLGASYVNKAVDINNQVTELDDQLRAERANLSDAQVKEMEGKLDMLVEERKDYFAMAIAPLERARDLMQANGEDASGACNALFTAYAQVGEEEKAKSAAQCAGIDLN